MRIQIFVFQKSVRRKPYWSQPEGSTEPFPLPRYKLDLRDFTMKINTPKFHPIAILALIAVLIFTGTAIQPRATQAADATPTIVPTMVMGGESCSASAAKIAWY